MVDPCSEPNPAITRSGGSSDIVYGEGEMYDLVVIRGSVLVVEFWHPAVTLFERVAIIEGTQAQARKGRERIKVQEVSVADLNGGDIGIDPCSWRFYMVFMVGY